MSSMSHAEWLSTTVEEILEPSLEIVDPHHHLWDFPTNPYRLAHLHADTGSGHNVTQTVFVECTWGYRTDGPEHLRLVGETEHVAAEARASVAAGGAEIAAIVSRADLTAGAAVEELLLAHDAAGDGKFRGIRHATAWDADPAIHETHTRPGPGLMGTAAFREGFATLSRLGFTYDAWLYHPQIHELTDLARAFPEATIICDHLGGPIGIGPYAGRRDEVLAAWRPQMTELAACPNVVLKVGGIGMTSYGMDWHRRPTAPTSAELAAAWGDEIRFCIDLFGADRCMFESNFPVDGRSVSYAVLWNTFKRIAADASPAERAELFAGTARRTYRIA